MKIYIVYGSSGSYDEYHGWDVVALTSECAAQEYVRKCQVEANTLKKELDSYNTDYIHNNDLTDEEWDNKRKEHEEFLSAVYARVTLDPGVDLTYAVSYNYHALELISGE